MKHLAIAAFFLLAGCQTTGPTIELTYQSALASAYAYKSLPICAAGVPDPCASRSVVQQMHDAQKVVDAAMIASRSSGTSEAAQAFQAALAAYKAVVALPSVQNALAAKGLSI